MAKYPVAALAVLSGRNVVNQQTLPLQPVPRLHHPLCHVSLTRAIFRVLGQRPKAHVPGFQAWPLQQLDRRLGTSWQGQQSVHHGVTDIRTFLLRVLHQFFNVGRFYLIHACREGGS